MIIVLLSADLMVVSRVEGAVRGGGAVKVAADSMAAVDACRATDASLVIVDLGVRGIDVAGLVGQFDSLGELRPRVVAFGPHVHAALLAAAEAAGCDVVMSRGEFFARVGEIVAGEVH